jgi:dihydroorotate dehydrogenase electron transfer subunit
MRLLDAELVETREILPRQWLQRYRTPWLASGARAGQFVHVRTPDYSGLVLRRPISINTIDRRDGDITLHFRVAGKGTELMARARPGDTVPMLGPLGRPFEVDPRTHRVLLIAGGLGIAGVRSLADEALEAGRQVTLLFGAAAAADVYPSSLLPDEVEYVVTTEDGSLGHPGRVTDLVPEYEAWADQAFACGPRAMLAALAHLAAGRLGRLGVAKLGRKRGGGRPVQLGSPQARRRAWLQVAMEQHMGCAVGACLGCVIWGVEGPVRVCREGPVFASDEIAWEEPA